MNSVLKTFSKIFDGDFYWDALHTSIYATDASVYRKIPLAVAYPKNEKAIQQLVAFARTHTVSLIPRAAGTSLAGQCVGDGIVVDVSKYFTKIISVNTKERTVVVEPGVVRDELNIFLKPYGLFFGPNTSTSNRCTIGGMVGNNSSGTTSIKYGVTRDKVVSLQVILSSGEAATFNEITVEAFLNKVNNTSFEGKIYKTVHEVLSTDKIREAILEEFPKPEIHRRNTGYAIDAIIDTKVFDSLSTKNINLAKLLCGSEGTLAFTTQVTLKLDPLPPIHSRLIVSQYASIEASLKDVSVAMKYDLHTCEMMDDVILNCTKQNKKYDASRFFVKGNPKALLLLEVKSHLEKEVVKKAKEVTRALTLSANAYELTTLEKEQIDSVMELRKAGLGLLGNIVGDYKAVACIEDTAVALQDLPLYIREFSSLMKRYKQKAVYYAHAGAGELHLRPILNLKTEEGKKYFREITLEVSKLVKKYKGSFSGEHGDGIVRAEFLKMQVGSYIFDQLAAIKKAFDPNRIFNPGKITDAWPMDQSLRADFSNHDELKTLLNFHDSGGILRLAEKCNGSGDCRKSAQMEGTMCPSYRATKEEKDTTRARANMLRETLVNKNMIPTNRFNVKELKQVMDLCLSCKACSKECPSNVDISSAKAEVLYQYYKHNKRPFSDIFFGKSSFYNKISSRFPLLFNTLTQNKVTANFIKKKVGIAVERNIPLISIKSFNNVFQSIEKNKVKYLKKVFLFVDEFSNYLDVTIAVDAYKLLNALGYKVEVVSHLDSARALISKGFLEQAKREIHKNVSYLKNRITSDTPLLGIEPSAIYGFKDEYLRLVHHEDLFMAQEIAQNTFLIEEFLASEISKGHIKSSQFTTATRQIKIHVHCHQKALSNQKVTFDILNLPKNYAPTLISSGCCGMAGSFGYEKEHYQVSMKIGELKLFPSIRKAAPEVLIAANGISCRHQIKDGTNKVAKHPITILRQALLLD